MFGAVKRAQAHYYDKPAWEAAVQRAMECDFSWRKSARAYTSLYASLAGVSEEEVERAIHEREKSLEASNSPQAIQPLGKPAGNKKPVGSPAKKPAAKKAAPAREKAPAAEKKSTKAPAKKTTPKDKAKQGE